MLIVTFIMTTMTTTAAAAPPPSPPPPNPEPPHVRPLQQKNNPKPVTLNPTTSYIPTSGIWVLKEWGGCPTPELLWVPQL